jgi:hypothetical protein
MHVKQFERPRRFAHQAGARDDVLTLVSDDQGVHWRLVALADHLEPGFERAGPWIALPRCDPPHCLRRTACRATPEAPPAREHRRGAVDSAAAGRYEMGAASPAKPRSMRFRSAGPENSSTCIARERTTRCTRPRPQRSGAHGERSLRFAYLHPALRGSGAEDKGAE